LTSEPLHISRPVRAGTKRHRLPCIVPSRRRSPTNGEADTRIIGFPLAGRHATGPAIVHEPNRPHIPSCIHHVKEPESRQQPIAPYPRRNKLPEPSIFPTAKGPPPPVRRA
jgi:hypothetical protein